MSDPTAALVLVAVVLAHWGFFGAYAWATTREAQSLNRVIDRSFERIDANFRTLKHQRDTLAHLVDSGDLDGAREMAGEILGGDTP